MMLHNTLDQMLELVGPVWLDLVDANLDEVV